MPSRSRKAAIHRGFVNFNSALFCQDSAGYCEHFREDVTYKVSNYSEICLVRNWQSRTTLNIRSSESCE